ncbi:MAG: hypothetical protein ACRELD_09735 [Longimicrobiales bacterium]
MNRAPITLLFPLFLLSGCYLEGLTDANSVELDFSVEPAGHGQWLEQPEFEVSGDVGQLTVTSRLSTPDPCQQLTGEASRSGSRVTLRITIVREGEGCYDVIGTFRYTALISGLAPGTYELRVIHDYPGTGWPSGPVLERDVAVR